jgi:chorismate lyase / 3-hydroxybenzoate synthase
MEVLQEPRWVAHGVLDRFATGLPEQLEATVEGRQGCVRFVRNETVLFGVIELDEAPLTGARVGALAEPASPARVLPVEAVTRRAYDALFACVAAEGFPYLARIWNFIPDIIGEQAGEERYRLFNVARQAAFAAAGRTVTGDVPAATGIGLDADPDRRARVDVHTDCGEDARLHASKDLAAGSAAEVAPHRLQIYFIASRIRPIPIENPRQVSAFHYPSQYGRKSPTFARAVVLPVEPVPVLLISGTASIVGHETVHPGDVAAQTRETLANLSALVAAANQRIGKAAFSLDRLAYRVYIRRPSDFAAVRAVLETPLGAAPRHEVRADICRPDLLVEIEASGAGRTGPADSS